MIALEFFFDDPFDPGGNGTPVQEVFESYDGLVFTPGIDFNIAVVQVLDRARDPELICRPLRIVPERHTLHTPLNDVMIRFHGFYPSRLKPGRGTPVSTSTFNLSLIFFYIL